MLAFIKTASTTHMISFENHQWLCDTNKISFACLLPRIGRCFNDLKHWNVGGKQDAINRRF
jgi:hypothetical protein